MSKDSQPRQQGGKSGHEVYLGLRQQALNVTPTDIGVMVLPDSAEAFGVVMDIGMTTGTATVVAFSTGDASLYLSTGGGVIGGIGHEEVRVAAKDFVSIASSCTQGMVLTSSFQLPESGKVAFYILTPRGVFRKEAAETDLQASELAPLYAAGQCVITELRVVSDNK